ncbi:MULTISPECIES: amidohydrolase family protein [Rhizobium]|uniref:amidohydrolase family protein n=1 Tax=Rhizobium TaxID=379 RepID=UPI00195A2DC1|nr:MULTISPECIES: amidohydrolase family protein [Rhizobium]MBM7044781.1 amidohydrolase family protein [Rhizobium lusitanum]
MSPRNIIDAHSHIGRTMTNGVGQDVDTWLAAMDAAGIAQSIISVAAGGLQAEGLADTRRANDVIAKAVREHPERFPIGLASIEVRHGEAGLAEVRRAMTEIGLSGLVFHTTFEGFGVDSPLFDSILTALGLGPALILMHSTPDGRANPTAIATVAKRFPQIHFLLGHPVFTEEQRRQCVKAIQENANLSLDLAYQADPATTEFFVREVGADRVLYGSDAPYFEPARVITSIETAKITDADKEQIFSGNAERLIKSLR